ERNGYDVNYTTDVDTDRRGALIRNHQVFLSVGHDEYWSAAERSNVETARDAGVNLAFFSGNEVYWRTRLGPSEAGTATGNRTVICYKETWGNAKIDTTSPQWTGTWRDPRYTPAAVGGGNPENALTGTAYMANTDDLTLQVPEPQGKLRLWRNTSVATLATGQTASLAPHTIGYESDEDLDNGFRPPGLIRLSTTTGPTPEYLRDFGNTVTPGTTTHHLTLYRAASGALVFAAGTVQWSWGLDSVHDGTASPADPRMQQATVNLFADMGAQPATLMAGLVAAGASTDTQGPTVSITAPVANAAVTNGVLVVLRGTATDTGGGRVAGVEVSTDGGTSWHPANGVGPWDYSFISSGAGTQQVRVRAVDDSANIGAATLLPLRLGGPSTILGMRGPANPSVSDGSAVELGVKFTPGDDGYVTGVRFYKGNLNTGTHTGSLWTATGTRLGTGTFTGESSAGWQTLTFASPIPVTGATTYVASYTAPNGHYAADSLAFSAADINSAPLVAPRSTQVSPNGLFAYGSGFPTQSYNDANYFVDVSFIDSEVGAPTSLAVNPPAFARTVGVGVHPSVVFSKSLTPASIQFTLRSQAGTAVAGTVSYDDATHTVTFTPMAALAVSTGYTATVMASDAQGHPADASTGWSFTTDAYTTIDTMFGANATPQVAADGDPNGVELGVKFVPAGNGTIIGVRFYQGPGNTGTHTGSLWSASGTLLARATFAGESGSGWQSVRFDTPVDVNADTTYVASYHAPNGHYSSTSNFFSTLWTNGPLSAPPTAANGVYRYGAEAFPQFSYNATNYWVDPLYVPDAAPDPDPSPSPSPSGPLGPPVGLFADTATPANANWDDPGSIEVGAKFTSTSSGVVTGVRFYKGPSNNGIHTASLWTAAGELLATASFTGETPSGWQTITFARGVPVAAGTTYVVSYWTSVGRYAVDFEAFAGHGVDRPPLHIPAGGSGYHYGGGFPDSPTAHNFWVDVVFRPNL
ncbi:MAG: hypothetical protein QOI74_1175, partial [Micromonosporaceae bacterium]|nr:hypothetical protein [Micromonosporaceae bacterium]